MGVPQVCGSRLCRGTVEGAAQAKAVCVEGAQRVARDVGVEALVAGWVPSCSLGLHRAGEEAGRPGAFPHGQGRGSGRAGRPLKLGRAGLGR